MLCLLFPALLKILALEPMQETEAAAFRHEFKQRLHALPFQDEADRADARPPVLARAMQMEASHDTSRNGAGNHDPQTRRLRPAEAAC
jgi:hypothetical protein